MLQPGSNVLNHGHANVSKRLTVGVRYVTICNNSDNGDTIGGCSVCISMQLNVVRTVAARALYNVHVLGRRRSTCSFTQIAVPLSRLKAWGGQVLTLLNKEVGDIRRWQFVFNLINV